MWDREFDWDGPIDDQTVRQVWNDLQMDFQDVSKFKLQRYIGTGEREMGTCTTLCASVMHETTVYLHQENDSDSEANVVFSKTRPVPVKEIAIPRLELMAILIGVRCTQYVKE